MDNLLDVLSKLIPLATPFVPGAGATPEIVAAVAALIKHIQQQNGKTTDEILAGLETALASGMRERLRGERNPYGDGHAADRVVRVLREVELGPRLIVKREVA